MSPESLKDWPVEDKGALFAILGDVEGSIGVRLSESTLMIPGRSLSGIYLPTKFDFIAVNCAHGRDVHREGPLAVKCWPRTMEF